MAYPEGYLPGPRTPAGSPAYLLRRGGGPLMVSMPHVGTDVPAALAARMTPAALTLADTDWHLPRVYDFLDALDATVLVATHSRLVIDLNRPPTGESLYPGQDTTGLIPVDTFRKEPVYAGPVPDEAQTDVDGVFALAALTPGRPYEIKAKRPGYAMSVQADLIVSPDRNNAVLTIVLGEGATVKGKVLDEAGKPVAKATVIAMEDLGMRAMRGGTALKRDYALTLEDGTYVLDTLTRGARYRFGVSAKGYAPIFDTMSGGLTVETEAERNFTLVKGGQPSPPRSGSMA